MKRSKLRESDFSFKPRGSNFKRDDASQGKGSPDERQRGSTVYRSAGTKHHLPECRFEPVVLPPHISLRTVDNRQPAD